MASALQIQRIEGGQILVSLVGLASLSIRRALLRIRCVKSPEKWRKSMKIAQFVRGGTIAAAVALLAQPTSGFAADNPQVAAGVIALARAQWAAEIAKKSGSEQNASLADDYTEFNPDYPTRLEGKAMSTQMADASGGDTAVFSDMQNAKVQVYGDTAILTYNFVGIRKDAAGKTGANTAKSTRIYVKLGGEWKLVHANFAPVK